MTGICGICPAEGNRLVIHPLGTSLDAFTADDIHYHGHTLAIEWKKESGLRVTVDGSREYVCAVNSTAAMCGEIRIEIEL